MLILGIETSCDECAASVVKDGKIILSNIIATQIEDHTPYMGVVPEIASRIHTEWISGVVTEALAEAKIKKEDLDGIAVANRPGLSGALLVGVSFAKGFAFSLGIPIIGVDHVKAHLFAPHLENDIEFPYIGLLVSGGHTVIAKVTDYDQMDILGSTIDDACGEAFDKVAKFYNFGYPGGKIIDNLAKKGNPKAFDFPRSSLHKGDHRYDVSYSGLKTAVINQLDKFWDGESEKSPENIAASFQHVAVDVLIKRVQRAIKDTGIRTVVAGGGVTSNSYLRERLKGLRGITTYYPSIILCTDNGAMIAALGNRLLESGFKDELTLTAISRVMAFRRGYP
ncbi:MAG: tRNA (adenosine(37)-N6)-threonylcarbamoyltransferase complex transferase subunit TsaD [Spirochaetaceae bacterium 4572_7]|nr:MAG: tRNA (adenosine(37)-N6)-threonylcarbamoyltransferase complex transferase subunit TsaD [Spirochaetaceae bacterium 4572_7]